MIKIILIMILSSYCSSYCYAVDTTATQQEFIMFSSSFVKAGTTIKEYIIDYLTNPSIKSDGRMFAKISQLPNTNYCSVWITTQTPQDNDRLNNAIVKRFFYLVNKRLFKVKNGRVTDEIKAIRPYPKDWYGIEKSTP